MKIFFFMIFNLVSLSSFSQGNLDINLLSQSHKFPMIDAKVYGTSHNNFSHGCPSNPGLTIFSSVPNVYSISDGTVSGVFDIGDSYAMIIHGKDDNFYTYSFFDIRYVSKGLQIKTGDLLGKSTFKDEKKRFEIVIMMANKKGNNLTENKIWEIIEKANSNSSAAVCNRAQLKYKCWYHKKILTTINE